MAETRQTTIRFGAELYERLAMASEQTGLPINSIVIVSCMEWLRREAPRAAYVRDPRGAVPAEEGWAGSAQLPDARESEPER